MSSSTPEGSGSDLLFDYATFLATSARGCIQEGVYSGSLRLLDALYRLKQVFPEGVEGDEFLKGITEFAEKGRTDAFLESKEGYVKFLDELLIRFAKEIKRRNGV